jgi:hypothetical protein
MALGQRRAGDGAVGHVAVSAMAPPPTPSHKWRGLAVRLPLPLGEGAGGRGAARLLPVLALSLLAGCKTVPQIAGVLSGAAAGGSTASPAIGFAVGVGVATATSAAERWYSRSRQHAEQQVIADVAGALPVGGRAPWRIRHLVPIGDEHGEISVLGEIVNPLAPCRAIAFSVADDPPRWYLADICRRARGWRWASAEPAVPRWGYLQ